MAKERIDYYTFPQRYGIIHSLEIGLRTLGGRLIEGSNHQINFEHLEMLATISKDDSHIILELKGRRDYVPRRFEMLFGALGCDGHYSADDLASIMGELEGIGASTAEDMKRLQE